MLKRVLLTSLLVGLPFVLPSFGRKILPTANAANDGIKTAVNVRKTKAAPKFDAKTAAKESVPGNPPTALLKEAQAWAESADFWKLVERGERLAARLEVLMVKSNALEAWVCGQAKICVSTRLLQAFDPEAQQAVVAHELGHLLISRNYEAHPQLWEAQCDLFAVAFLRDAEQMKGMLLRLGDECANCQDQEHPLPSVRAALVEQCSATALTEVLKFDEFRRRSYAVQFRGNQASISSGLLQLSFSVKNALTTPGYVGELKSLSFAVRFHPPTQRR